MADHEDYSLISLPDASLANTTVGAKLIPADIINDTFALTQKQNLNTVRLLSISPTATLQQA